MAEESAVIKVEGMSCQHCVGRVETGLQSTEGVKSVEVSLEEKEARIDYDPEQVTLQQLKDSIVASGYKPA